jgi:hypothetical protein
MDNVNLNKSIQSKCVNKLAQNYQIRFSQNGNMLQRITKATTENTTEREAPAKIEYSNLFSLDTISKKFSMDEAWQPTEQFAKQCKLRIVNLSKFSADDQEDLINEFRSYWMIQSTQLNQAGWEHKLIGSLKRSQERKQTSVSLSGPQSTQLLALLADRYLKYVYKKKHSEVDVAVYLDINKAAYRFNIKMGLSKIEGQLLFKDQLGQLAIR